MTQDTAVQNDIQSVLDRYLDAVRRLDLDAIVSFYAPDIVAYDAIAQLEFRGVDAFKAHWKMCLDHCHTMVFDPQSPTIHASGDLAAGHYLVHCGGSSQENEPIQKAWMRASFVARKKNGRWQLVHEHYSMPFDPMTNKVMSDLQPQG